MATEKQDTWTGLGKSMLFAEALVNRRDKESAVAGRQYPWGGSKLLKDSVVSTDTTLRFSFLVEVRMLRHLSTEYCLSKVVSLKVPVMKPDVLEEQTGRREIRRLNFFRGEIRPNEKMGVKGEVAYSNIERTNF